MGLYLDGGLLMEFFDGELDTNDTIAALLPAFPLRVRVGRVGQGVSRTGSLTAGAFQALAGYENIPATKSGPNTKQQSVALSATDIAVVGHVWTLLGAWPEIKPKMIIQLLDTAGNIINGAFEVLLADVHDFGIHTEVRTRAAS